MVCREQHIFSLEDVRAIDRRAIEDHAIPAYTLMKRAGDSTFAAISSRFPDANSWQIICGAGNNAGDGYVVARRAKAAGITASVITLVDPHSLSGAAAKAHGAYMVADGVVERWSGALDPTADVLVDAIVGSGLTRSLEGDFAEAVTAINAHNAAVVSLDIPSGIEGDSGTVSGAAVFADVTTTFVALKPGLFLGSGPEHSGYVVLCSLDIPAEAYSGRTPLYRRIDGNLLRENLGRRASSSHKGDFGHVLVIGGYVGMPGAVRLAGEAALRTGAGLVSIATHPTHASQIVASRPELMVHAVARARDLEPLLSRADVIAFGPGLGRSAWARELFELLIDDPRLCVWDADALKQLAQNSKSDQQTSNLEMSNQPVSDPVRVITPHPGEAANLLGQSTAEVQRDRLKAHRDLERTVGGIVVLKGSGSLVSSATGVPWLCSAGNPGMASAGMGDVLTGIIAALIAQGLSLEMAAAVGVEVHARAGDLAARSGERGLLASDLVAQLRSVVNP